MGYSDLGAGYIPLHVHSYYSLCTGVGSPEDYLDAAARFGLKALALTDTANLYGGIAFYQAARARGIKPILGAQIPAGRAGVVALARNHVGYENLCWLVTRVRLGCWPDENGEESLGVDSVSDVDKPGRPGRADLVPITPEQVAAHAEGLILLVASPELLEALLPLLPREQLAAEVVRPGRDINAERSLLELAARRRVRVAATTAAVFLSPGDFRTHRVLVAVRENLLVTQMRPEDLALPGHYLCSPSEFAQRFADLPEAVRCTLEIADGCDLELPLGRAIFPKFPLHPGQRAEIELRRLAEEGVRRRFARLTKPVRDRLNYELGIIERLGFADYFLVVADIVRFARGRGIPNVGRGSGASSLVSYALGITHVDPMRYNIHFERFLNLSRSDYPDIDLDFCWQRRDEVIAYVFQKYGSGHTAMIATHNTFRGCGAFREVAKACGVSHEDLGRLDGAIPSYPFPPARKVIEAFPGRMTVCEEHLERILRHAQRIVGFPRHLSVHCGGVVITPGRIDAHTPLERAAKGVVISQFEMNAVEDLGLVKIDLLGNRALSTIAETVRLVETHRHVRLCPEDVAETDAATFDLIRRGLTVGCNQLESPAMRNLLQMCTPHRVEDLVAALALIRPGAAGDGMKEEYVRRARGLSPVTFPHPCVEDILRDSLGIMLYEDDAMLVASRMASLSLEEGDRFRKAIQKAATAEAREDLGEWFFGRCAKRGIAPAAARKMWSQMVKFGAYSFCKSHACGYGQIAYQCAYLKTHFPAEFMVAVMNHHGGMYPRAVHIEEAKRLGVQILLPCVNRSEAAFTVERGNIRVGLSPIRGLPCGLIEEILGERARRGPFESLNDLLGRMSAGLPEVESLILCGAFDFSGRTRPQLLWELRLTFEAERRTRAAGKLFRGNFHALSPPRLKDFDPLTRLTHELHLLELSAGQHVLSLLRPSISFPGLTDSRWIPRRMGQPIRLLGMLDATRSVDTAQGQRMSFATLEDEHSLWECILFPEACRRWARQLGPWGPYVVEGRVEEQYGAVTINVARLQLLPVEGR